MPGVRPLAAGDLGAVATLYQETFSSKSKPGSSLLAACLKEFYLTGPTADPEIPSLVYKDSDGEISGFVGVNVVPMAFSGRLLKAAFCGALMVRKHEKDPLAGARLLKAVLAGSQDIALSETANKTSLELSKPMKGTAFAGYSLEWMKVFKPAAFTADMILRKSALRQSAIPIARGCDTILKWAGMTRRLAIDTESSRRAPLSVHSASAAEFADSVDALTSHYPFRQAWTQDQLRHVMANAYDKPRYGQAFGSIAIRGDGRPVGAFLYHLQPSGVGRVFQILALPGEEGKVIDSLFSDAAARGAAGLRGRTQPALLDGMLGKRVAFASASSTVVFSRDEAVLECFRTGRAFVNGIVGESWGRHIGGEFS